MAPEELVLGAVLAQYHEVLAGAESESIRKLPKRDQLVATGVQLALEEHVTELRRAADAAAELTGVIDEKVKFEEQTSPRGRTAPRSAKRATKKAAKKPPRT